jgi:hypothetical protein
MGIAEKMWDALATVIRLIHLEATLQVLMQLSATKLPSPKSSTKQIGRKD